MLQTERERRERGVEKSDGKGLI